MSKINWLRIVISGLLASLPLAAKAETVLNRFQNDDQEYPSAVSLSNGNFVVGWFSDASALRGLYYNIFDDEFDPQSYFEGEASRGPGLTTAWIRFAASEDSFYVAAFARWTWFDSTNIDIYINKFTNEGARFAEDETRVNEDTIGNQWVESVVLDDQEDMIIVVWGTNPDYNPGQRHYYMRQMDFELNPLTDDIPIYIEDDESIRMRGVVRISPTRLMAIFHRDSNDPFQEVVAKHFNFDGSDPSDLFVVNTYPDGDYLLSSIARIPAGGALITWVAYDVVHEVGIWGRRFDTYGDPIDDADVLLSIPDDEHDGLYEIQNSPAAAFSDEGDKLALSWSQQKGFNQSFDIVGRFFDPNLRPLSDTFTVSETGTHEGLPVVVHAGPDNFVSVWHSYVNSNRGTDIFGAIMELPETDVEEDKNRLPQFYISAYPNPFNTRTTLQYSLPLDSHVVVEIYDVLGRSVGTILDEKMYAGYHQIEWNADDKSSGMYFYRIQAGKYSETKKMLLLK